MSKNIPDGFTPASATDRRVFGSEKSRKAASKKPVNPPSDAEAKAYKNLVRRYKRRSGKGLDYLPDEVKRRVEKKAPDLVPNLRAFKKMNPGERLNLFRQLEGYLRQKATTKKGYNAVVDNRYKTWKKKVPGLTKKQFEAIVKNGLFNDLKQFYDSDQIIDDIASIVSNPNAKDKAVQKYLEKIESLTHMKSGKEAQKKYAEIQRKVRSGDTVGKRIITFLKSLFKGK